MSNGDMNDYYKVPKEVVHELMGDLNSLRTFVEELIKLRRSENKLKKNHKAYRHIREYTDMVCEEQAIKVKLIEERWKDLTFEELDADLSDEVEAEPLKKLAKNVAGQMKEKELNDILRGLVMMPSDTLGMMQEDMLVLAETVDLMAALLRINMNGKTVPEQEMRKMLAKVAVMTDEITCRWEDAEVKVIV